MKRIFTSLSLVALLSGGLAQASAETTTQTYSLESGAGHVVAVDASLMFYDDGGPEANITPGFEGTVTFHPLADGKVLTINADEFSIGNGRLYVYSGREADASMSLGKASGYFTTTGPAGLLSKAADGSLTVDFKAHATASTLKGWAMTVTAVDAVAMDVASVSVTDGEADAVVRGSADVPVAHVALEVAGNSGTVGVSGLEVDFGGSSNIADIERARVFYTAANNAFAPVNAICGATSVAADGKVTFTFPSPLVFDEAGTYNFWITADIATGAAAGNRVSATLSSVVSTGSGVTVPADSGTGSCTLKEGIKGTFRVGASEQAAYHTIAEAVAALSAGVEDAVLFMLEDGEYKENITIADVKGGSASHPVVFTSLSGNRDKVVISGGEALSDRGIVTVDNSSFVHLRNLTVAIPEPSSSTEHYAGILFRNGSRYCSVENCVVSAAKPAPSETALVRVADGGNTENTNCDYLTVKDSYFNGGYIAIYVSGTGIVELPKIKGVEIARNTVSNPYFKGIYVNDCQDFLLTGNSVKSETARKSYNAIDVFRPHGAYRILGNKVTMMQTTDGTGIYLRTGGGLSDASNPALVANNVVAIPNAKAGYTYGIMLDASLADLIVAHNTVGVKGAATLKGVYALAFSGKAPAGGAASVCNNILQNTTASGPLRPWDATHYANMKFAGNVYFGGGGVMDGDGKTFDEYREAAADNSSQWAEVSFFGDADLHLREAPESMAVPRMDAVVTDAEGTARHELTTPGAYEFAEVVSVAPEIMDGYPAIGAVKDVSATVNTRWTVGGSLYAKAVKADAAEPSREELLAVRPVVTEADTETPSTFNFLDQLTKYKAYFLMVSALGDESQIVASQEFTTAETIDPLMALIDWDEEPVNAGESIVLQAYVAGGKEPYAYTWVDQMNEPVGSADLFTCEASVNQTYRLEVTSADGQTVRAKALVPVIAPALGVATFDDLHLPAESNWMWDSDATEDTYEDAFFSGSFRFGNFPMVQWGAWSGYGYANETATAFNEDYANQCRNVVGGGAAGTRGYGVAYMGFADMTIRVSAPGEGFEIPGVYVTNAAVTADKILNGDGWCKKFTAENGDYMTLLIYGYDADGVETGMVEVSLAEFRGEQGAAGGFVLSDWKWVDLSPLGAVSTLKFDYDSKQKDHVPSYVCFDQLGAANPGSGLEAVAEVADGIRLAVPAPDCLAVFGAEGAYTLRIYTADGVLRATYALEGAATVSTAAIPAGACIAEVAAADGSRRVLRFMKK